MCDNFSLWDFTLISMVFGFLPHSEWAANKKKLQLGQDKKLVVVAFWNRMNRM
jgi:hypothetical protein